MSAEPLPGKQDAAAGASKRRLLNPADNSVVRAVGRVPAGVHVKLLVAFVGTVLVVVLLGVLGLRLLGESNDRVETLGALQVRAFAYGKLRSDAGHVRLLQTQNVGGDFYGVFPAENKRDAGAGDLAIDQAIASAVAQIPASTFPDNLGFRPPPEDEPFLRRIRATGRQLTSVTREIVEAGSTAPGRVPSLRTRAELLAIDLNQHATELANAMTARTNAVIAQNARAYEKSRNQFIGVAAGAIVLALLLGFVLSWSVIGPIQRIDSRLAAIASGDFSGKVDITNRDELGALAANVNRMNDELRRLYKELEAASQHKSEFLANMSHELRTPLNSMLILARLFSENPEQNLTPKQIEFAKTIYTAGSDLLTLINDILDLSKVEAGKMDVHVTDVGLGEVRDYVNRTFRPVAEEKGLGFDVEIEDGLPQTIATDEQRLQQVLKNLLSNACKFTKSGTVSLRVSRVADEAKLQERTLREADDVVAFAVTDTGVGIPADKLKLIFEAFQQADGTTSRRYGGTGLGLSISREIARLLGGEIHVRSTPGEGSTFTLYLPVTFTASRVPDSDAPLTRERSAIGGEAVPDPIIDPALVLYGGVDDDRGSIDVADRVVLIVEDDETFAKTVLEVARQRGFRGIVALRGDAGLALAHEYKPDAIVLDMALPGMDGWAVLDHLKRHPDTRHIPVHVVTGAENGKHNALKAGAVAFLEKPVEKALLDEAFSQIAGFLERRVRNLLVVDDESAQRQALTDLLGDGEDINVTAVASSEEALAELEQRPYDCMVLDLKLPDMQGFQLLERVKSDERFSRVPVIIYTAKQLTRKEETALRRYAETIVVKDVNSPERLLDETTLFLHRVESRLPAEKRKLLQQLHSADAVFEGKKVLIVDDDVRNVFALTNVLESRRMHVRYAENGLDALKLLDEDPRVDVVLMDIMMPELDGYETIRRIRAMPQFASLPIISLTAKAMKGDREKSIAAGASDYITKPVDTDKLVSLLRVWLYDSSAVKA
ncbi:MAG: response regulator [Gaiellaceae bacterium]